jgi:hypothetical protein
MFLAISKKININEREREREAIQNFGMEYSENRQLSSVDLSILQASEQSIFHRTL